jgi:hypothetical protein
MMPETLPEIGILEKYHIRNLGYAINAIENQRGGQFAQIRPTPGTCHRFAMTGAVTPPATNSSCRLMMTT